MTTTLEPAPPADLVREALRLDRAPAAEVVAWAADRFGAGLTLTSSFTDCVLLDVVTRVVPDVDVVFLDTGYHFPETLAYLDLVRDRYDLRLRVLAPETGPDDRWRTDTDACCAARKVQPLARALEGRAAWVTGLRRSETAARAMAPVLSWDERRGLVKVNPLATWTDADVAAYAAGRDLPRHPLEAAGFRSIGCWPCTRATRPGEDARAGRWPGTGKTECGLHL
jgi:phosphoadenosine phosphosulfate reductase